LDRWEGSGGQGNGGLGDLGLIKIGRSNRDRRRSTGRNVVRVCKDFLRGAFVGDFSNDVEVLVS